MWTTRRGEVLWTYVAEEKEQGELMKLVLLRLFVAFLRNCPVLEKIVDTERLESHRVRAI
jgi:hypothetical protein